MGVEGLDLGIAVGIREVFDEGDDHEDGCSDGEQYSAENVEEVGY